MSYWSTPGDAFDCAILLASLALESPYEHICEFCQMTLLSALVIGIDNIKFIVGPIHIAFCCQLEIYLDL